jgi:hypothetical protein
MNSNEKLTTVFVVEAGDYSNCRIVGAFSEKERAEKYAGRFSKYGEGRVYELRLDCEDLVVPDGYDIFDVTLYIENGDVKEVRRLDPDIRKDLKEPPYVGYPKPGETFGTTCVARNREHAIKIANERLAQWKAEHPVKPEKDDTKYTTLFDDI